MSPSRCLLKMVSKTKSESNNCQGRIGRPSRREHRRPTEIQIVETVYFAVRIDDSVTRVFTHTSRSHMVAARPVVSTKIRLLWLVSRLVHSCCSLALPLESQTFEPTHRLSSLRMRQFKSILGTPSSSTSSRKRIRLSGSGVCSTRQVKR